MITKLPGGREGSIPSGLLSCFFGPGFKLCLGQVRHRLFSCRLGRCLTLHAGSTCDGETHRREEKDEMNDDIAAVIDEIAKLPPDWHGAGSLSPNALRAIARHAENVGTIQNSMETGAGKTTLLFSHLSSNHIVFALDGGKSISQVKSSPLFNPTPVTFVEGPTQLTLPHHKFVKNVQIALIDGPHAYPFPDIEYYYFYPLIQEGGLLLVDDIKIPSIRRMFDIIAAEDMFKLVDVIDNNLSIFRRTEAPLIDPQGDGWWLQGYNREHYEEIQYYLRPRRHGVLSFIAGMTPRSLKKIVPAKMKKTIRQRM